jgi:hypothetical protein
LNSDKFKNISIIYFRFSWWTPKWMNNTVDYRKRPCSHGNSNRSILRVWYNTEPTVINDTETLIETNTWIRIAIYWADRFCSFSRIYSTWRIRLLYEIEVITGEVRSLYPAILNIKFSKYSSSRGAFFESLRFKNRKYTAEERGKALLKLQKDYIFSWQLASSRANQSYFQVI